MTLHQFWSEHGCLIMNPYDIETGAGTMNPATFLRSIGPEHWKAAYVEPSRRPSDGRYGGNPNRLYQHHQYQVILKPIPDDIQDIYLNSLQELDLNPLEHDIRFVEDNWESPTLGAWGLGWEIWLDGMEVTQFTYFQQIGGLECNPISVELTYGLERLASYLQGKENVFELEFAERISYSAIFRQSEFEHSKYTFEVLEGDFLFTQFRQYECEAWRCIEHKLIFPAYDYVLKCSHVFNQLVAAGVISVSERATYIDRVRNLSHQIAVSFLEERRKLEFPLLQDRQSAEILLKEMTKQ